MLFQLVTPGSNLVPVEPLRFMKDRLQKYHHDFRSKLPKNFQRHGVQTMQILQLSHRTTKKIEMVGYVQSGKCL